MMETKVAMKAAMDVASVLVDQKVDGLRPYFTPVSFD
jgi:hypothetical protein